MQVVLQRTSLLFFLLLLLLLQISAFAESVTLSKEVRCGQNSCAFHFECEFEPFLGEEVFSVPDSDRIAAFATGWEKWQGSPELRDYDVLCYMPAKLNNPFRYVFFSAEVGTSSFVIKNNEVYRDSVLYGVSVRTPEQWDKAQKVASEVSYLYLDCEIDNQILIGAASRFKKLRYLCTSVPQEVIFQFVGKCPVEYFHSIAPFEHSAPKNIKNMKGISISDYLRLHNVALNVETRQSVLDWKVEAIKNNLSSIRFLTVDACIDKLGWQLVTLFKNLEGVIIASNYEKEFIYYMISQLAKLRILVDYGADFSIAPVYIPSNLIVSAELEHLHVDYLKLPDGIRFHTRKLKSLTIKKDIVKIAKCFELSHIEYLSLESISDWNFLSSASQLRILEVLELKEAIVPNNLKLKQLRVMRAQCSKQDFVKLLQITQGGEMVCLNFKLITSIESVPPIEFESPSSVLLNWFSTSEDGTCSESVTDICKMLKRCPNFSIITEEKLSKEAENALRNADGCNVYGTQKELVIKNKGIALDFAKYDREVSPILAKCFSCFIEEKMDICSAMPANWHYQFLLRGIKSLATIVLR